jgi:AcrR family transcriptional regulator
MIVIDLPFAAPRKWTRKPLERREEVLEAALNLFAQTGFAATRMEDIAKGAGISKAAIYLYFPSKSDVFKALVETRIVSLRQSIAAQASDMLHDPIAGLKQVVQLWAASNADPRMIALPRIVLAEAARFPELAEFYHAVAISQTQAVLVTLIEAGIAQGKFRVIDPKITARALVAPMLFEMLRRQAFKEEGTTVPIADMVSTFFDLFLSGILSDCPSKSLAGNIL